MTPVPAERDVDESRQHLLHAMRSTFAVAYYHAVKNRPIERFARAFLHVDERIT